MANFLKSDDYNSFTDLTDAILLVPNQWGRINQMGLFENEALTNTSVSFDVEEDTLVLLDSSRRGTRKGTVGKDESRQTLAFPLSFYEQEDRVTPQDVQGRRRTGTADEVDTVTQAVSRKLAKMRMQHAITHEFMKMSALKGVVVSPNGSVFADLFTSYNFTQKEVDFVLGTDTTDIDGKIREVLDEIEDNALMGMASGAVKCFVSSEFFQKLIAHPKVREAYLNYQQPSNPDFLVSDLRTGSVNNGVIREFTYGGISFEVYRASYTKSDGATERLIAANEGHAFPLMGAGSDMYKNYLGPADHMEYINTLGEEAYAWSFPDPQGRWLDLASQSAILPLVRRPKTLVKVLTSN